MPTSELVDFPHAPEAERSLIGSILIDPQMMDEVNQLRPMDFYSSANQSIWQTLQTMHTAGDPLDLVLLTERMKASKAWKRVQDGNRYLMDCIDTVNNPASAIELATVVSEEATRRNLIHALSVAIRDCRDAGISAQEAVRRSQEAVFQVVEEGHQGEPVNLTAILRDLVPEISKRKPGQAPAGGVKTGFRGLDKKIGGLTPEALYIIAARPGVGKTAFGLNIAKNVALTPPEQGGGPVLIVSLEMSRGMISERLLISESKVDGLGVRDGFASAEDHVAMKEAAGRLNRSGLVIDDWVGTVEEIVSTAQIHKRRHGLKLVVVDYLQLVQPTRSRSNREEEVAHISKSLKRLARSAKVPVIALAQINREIEKATNPKPKLAYLRESGSIEQDADVVAFLWQSSVYHNTDCEIDEATRQLIPQPFGVFVAKQRSGPTGDAYLNEDFEDNKKPKPLWWYDRQQRFSDTNEMKAVIETQDTFA